MPARRLVAHEQACCAPQRLPAAPGLSGQLPLQTAHTFSKWCTSVSSGSGAKLTRRRSFLLGFLRCCFLTGEASRRPRGARFLAACGNAAWGGKQVGWVAGGRRWNHFRHPWQAAGLTEPPARLGSRASLVGDRICDPLLLQQLSVGLKPPGCAAPFEGSVTLVVTGLQLGWQRGGLGGQEQFGMRRTTPPPRRTAGWLGARQKRRFAECSLICILG